MCGIVGKLLFAREGVVSRADLQRMCDTIVHRGPDDEGTYACGPVGLGMRRLSIIDIDGGHQPMRTSDGRLTIVFNGEIYNYRELRQTLEQKGCRFTSASDTECILHGYAVYGTRCLEHLNGMFAFALWDATRRELFVARDRLGIKPLYWCEDSHGVAFASEIKALLIDPAVPRTLDAAAFSYFLSYGYVPSPATLLRSVRQLPPAHFMVAGEHGVTVNRYWSLHAAGHKARTATEAAEVVYELTKRAVTRQLVSDVPLGAFLSGGLDSSSLVHLMAQATGAPVNTYSIGFAGVDTFHNELDDARYVSQHYGTTHHEIIVRPEAASMLPRLVHHLDQPLSDSSLLVTAMVSELATNTVKVIISGVGGDEIFGGYRRYLGPSLDRYYQRIPRPLRRVLSKASSRLPVDRGSTAKNYFRLARTFLRTDGMSAYDKYDGAVRMLSSDDVRAISPGVPDRDAYLVQARRQYFDEVNAVDPVAQMQRLDLNTSLVDSLLQLTDKMTMAASLEARVPLLDHELVEAVAAMPTRLKVDRGRLRLVQKASMRGRLPDRVLTKKKRGFGCPVGAWFRTELRPLVRDTLAPAALRGRGMLDEATVSAIIAAHEQCRDDHSDLLLALLTFQLWCDEWRVT